jgi:hypothetical protein
MTNITINKIELASELAHQELMANYNDIIKIFEGEEDDDCTTYTEHAQDIFNEYYDNYLALIESCKA